MPAVKAHVSLKLSQSSQCQFFHNSHRQLTFLAHKNLQKVKVSTLSCAEDRLGGRVRTGRFRCDYDE